MARKARVEGAVKAAPKPPRPSVAFRDAVRQFQADYPDKWAEIALSPTQHGLEAMAEVLEKA